MAKARDIHQSLSDEVGYLRETRFDMLETFSKIKEANNEFDYYWKRFAITMCKAKSALEDAMTRLMSPILSLVVQHSEAGEIRREFRTCFQQMQSALACLFYSTKNGGRKIRKTIVFCAC